MDNVPFPEIKIFSPLERVLQVGHFLLDQMHHEPPEPRGAAFVIDAALYDERG